MRRISFLVTIGHFCVMHFIHISHTQPSCKIHLGYSVVDLADYRRLKVLYCLVNLRK
ncbi:putative signal peptide protein [Puccinia sorghi]|uniref:Putative signal peptide protein n=1 Tax=Puccinia sorghi TaxID=27349 RepID=A0A0L6UBY0_9BASI|nr:putative signal peptide protein [Puccinia sorghi]